MRGRRSRPRSRRSTAGGRRTRCQSLKDLAGRFPDAPVFQTTYGRALKDAGRPAEAVAVYRQAVHAHSRREPLSRPGGRRAGGRQRRGSPQGRAGGAGARGTESSGAQRPRAPARGSRPCGRRRRRRSSRPRHSIRRTRPTGRTSETRGGSCRICRRPSRRIVARSTSIRTSRDAANGLGTILVQTGKPADAVPWFERAVQQAPDFYEARLNLGIALQESGQRGAGGGRVSRDSRQRPAAFRARARRGERPAATGDEMIAPERVRLSASMSTEEHDRLSNVNVVSSELLPTPEEVKRALPLTARAEETVFRGRAAVRAILDRRDPRLFVVVGPCSIHDLEAAREYAGRLKELAGRVSPRRCCC